MGWNTNYNFWFCKTQTNLRKKYESGKVYT